MKINVEVNSNDDVNDDVSILVCTPYDLAPIPNSTRANCFFCGAEVAVSPNAPEVTRKSCLECFGNFMENLEDSDTLDVQITKEQMAEMKEYRSRKKH